MDAFLVPLQADQTSELPVADVAAYLGRTLFHFFGHIVRPVHGRHVQHEAGLEYELTAPVARYSPGLDVDVAVYYCVVSLEISPPAQEIIEHMRSKMESKSQRRMAEGHN